MAEINPKRINVLSKVSGLTGTLPAEKFDSNRYVLLDDESVLQPQSKIQTAIEKRRTNVQAGFERESLGQQTMAESVLQSVGQGVGLVNDIIGMGISAVIPDKIEQGIGKAISKSELIQKGVAGYQGWKQNNPRAAADLESVLNIASLYPTGKTVEGIAQAGVKAGTKTLTTIGKATQKVGEKTTGVASIFTPTPAQAPKIMSYRANVPLTTRMVSPGQGPRTVAQTANKYNLFGLTESQIGVKAIKAKKSLWSKTVEPALKNIKGKASKDKIFSKVDDIINEEADLTRKNALQNAFDAIKDDYKPVSNWSYPELQNLKSELTKLIPQKAWKGQEIAGNYNQVRKIMSDVMREEITKKIAPTVRSAYLDYGNLKTIAERGTKELLRPSRMGGSGRLVWEMIDTATTPILSTGGRVTTGLGGATRKIGEIGEKLIKHR